MSEFNARVLIADAIESSELAALRDMGAEVLDRAGISAPELAELLPTVDALVVRSRTKVTAALLANPGRLRVIGRAGVGVDNVDLEAATRAGVIVMNTPGGNVVAAAEQTIALMFAVARRTPAAVASLRRGEWEQKPYVGVELTGKTLGVLGLGRIGREVAKRAQGLQMVVQGFDPLMTPEAASSLGVRLATLEQVLESSDFVTVHVPYAPATKNLLNAERLQSMRRGAYLLNVARGGIVDEAALLNLLESGHLAGAGFDVFESEPPTNRALVEHPRMVATPHLGASTKEAQSSVARQIAEQIAKYLEVGAIENAVNMPSVGGEMAVKLRPWARLARRLGGVAAALAGNPLERIEIVTFGSVGELPRALLVAETLFGVLSPFVEGRVAPVNARWYAEERGIVTLDRHEASHPAFTGLLRVTVTGPTGTVSLDGTLFGLDQLRIVRSFGFNMDAVPEGPMVFVGNADRPGVVAHLSGVLAAARVNIANMSVGRDPARGEALAVFNLDQELGESILKDLAADERIRWVRYVPGHTTRS